MSDLNEATIIRVRNVNQALSRLRSMLRDPKRDYFWRDISPRGLQTLEYRGPVITEYQEPTERVLWSPHRDANPFFHLMESLWILAGRNDVKFLTEFNANMASYSDDGIKFHAPYGYRLRNWEMPYNAGGEPELEFVDQIQEAVKLLRADHSTRQVVLSIWDPVRDLGTKTKDMPCNDIIAFKIRDGALQMTVWCRSNDAIWGAYGANVVQFSVLQEFIAGAVGVPVGIYRQFSDSFHVYTDQTTWHAVRDNPDWRVDLYQDIGVQPYDMFTGVDSDQWEEWLTQCEAFCEGDCTARYPFFTEVATPMREAWRIYKDTARGEKTKRIEYALAMVESMPICDWQMAAKAWLTRRVTK